LLDLKKTNNNMKAAIFQNPGIPKEALEIKEVKLPSPEEGQARIKVIAANINPSDVMFVQGLYGIRPELPSPAGFEGVGIVDAVGEGVKIKEGTRVSFTSIGAWAEYALTEANSLIPIPDAIPDEVACQLFVNPFTAFALLHEAGLKEGDYLLLTAGGSTFSQLVVQIAAKRGIKTICTVRRDIQIEQLKELGAHAVINTEKENLLKSIMALTDKKGVPVCMDAVGGELAGETIHCLAKGGKMLVYGMLSLKESPIHNGMMIFKNLKIEGFWLTTWLRFSDKSIVQKIAGEVIGAFSKNELKVNIEKKYDLSEIANAVTHADSPGRKGKIIITI
jgi:NADPH:quinone reductase-like Zn-dependent oxidoreductase